MWLGYLHSSGTLQSKRWSYDHKDYIEDCQNNQCVIKLVATPFENLNREKVLSILRKKLYVNSHDC